MFIKLCLTALFILLVFAVIFMILMNQDESSSEIQEAVDLQMQPLWTAVDGTAFDSIEELNDKQKKINELSTWANRTTDRRIRNAQLHWISVAQYTIDHAREELSKKKEANKILPSLPPLPNIKREFP